MYFKRLIDGYLEQWAKRNDHKPMLLRGARQVGKSTAVRHLGEMFDNFVEINFEKQPEYKTVFKSNLVVERIVSEIWAISSKPILPGMTFLVLDDIQECQAAIMSLRFFKEDMPELHVIAAGSLLEFALAELPTFGVGRIHSMYMHAMTFDEYLEANGETILLDYKRNASPDRPLPEPLHDKLTALVRSYFLVGGMPEAVGKWVETHDYLQCQEVQDDIISGYEDDFPKYRKAIDPVLLRLTLRSAAAQITKKFSYSEVGGGYRTEDVKKALELLLLAGICTQVVRTDANGLPLGSESDFNYRKILILDSGLLLRLLNMSSVDVTKIISEILTEDTTDLVNKGPLAEMVAGLEMLRYKTPNLRHELYYWVRLAKNSQAEIDYVEAKGGVLPIEVKAGMRGGMKSLWIFMREKGLTSAVRCSLENFGRLEYVDKEASDAVRKVDIYPLYALSNLIEP
ncbi:MAG: ATP-binding protein [Muribaculaceae bacterium]|nr:ATP-binding protein [Muribaculaceae bacterium]